jgi:hypothetical protein
MQADQQKLIYADIHLFLRNRLRDENSVAIVQSSQHNNQREAIMTTMQLFHEYTQQPTEIIKSMRFDEWSRAKAVCEGSMAALQAIEAARNERAEVRRSLGWNLK